MGIRYYGWAVTAEETARAYVDPWSVVRDADHRYAMTGSSSVGLDKAWRLMQGLFRPEWTAEPRAGYALVAGDVTYPEGYERGYEPHIGVLPHEQVRAIAADVASIGEADVRTYFAGLCYDDENDRLGEQDYVTSYLRAAQEFTADAAARGQGIVYMIG